MMNIQNSKIAYVSQKNERKPKSLKEQKKQISFRATPEQILDKLETAKLCPGKKGFLKGLAEYFLALQEKLNQISGAPQEFIYKMGETNVIPEQLKGVKINGFTLEQLDEALNDNPFKCSPTSTCKCGQGMSKGSFAKELFEMINVEKPEIIEISANKGKKE